MNKLESENVLQRSTWSKAWDFIFSCAGMTVGLGNVWRFPYLCYENGGGAFLVPYLLCAITLALPLVYLEISFGQSLRSGILKSWSLIPIFKGIAFCNMVIMVNGNLSYPILFSWIIKFLVGSFSSVLPWTSCNNTWNTENCIDFNSVQKNVSRLSNLTLYHSRFANISYDETIANLTSSRLVSAGEEYLKISVWGLSDGIDHLGSLRLDLALYVGLMWLLTFLAIFRGIGWSAKVVYFTATAPVILILVVLVKGVTLDGATTGIQYYLYPNVTRLGDPEVWVKASTQVFYSMALGLGALLSMGSYNKRNHNFQRDCVIIVACNALTSFISGFAVFSVLGFMAKQQNCTLEEVVKSGPGLVFIAYPQALSMLPLPNFWCALFFVMLLLLGFDSLYVYVETLQTFVTDCFPRIQRMRCGKELFCAIMCLFFWIVSLPMVTEGGVYIFEIFNQYGAAGWCIYFTCCCQFIAIGWCYGAERHFDEIYKMTGYTRMKPILTFIWKFYGPVMTLICTLYYFTAISPLSFEDYVYPVWAQAFAQMLSVSVVIMIPICGVYACVKHKLNCSKLSGRDNVNFDEEGKAYNPIPLTVAFSTEHDL